MGPGILPRAVKGHLSEGCSYAWAMSPTPETSSHRIQQMGLNLPPPQAATPGGKDVIKGLRTFVQNLGIGTSLVGELRSHMPHGQETQNIKQKQYCM